MQSKNQKKDQHKYIFVLGGVMSGVGKGVTTSSIGNLLIARGYKINMVKIDPYLNVDAGTMNPTEHGEVFVMKNGLETDQDMGNYERFTNRSIDPACYMTSGMIYKSVIERERALGYKGKCVEAIPDIRDEIINRLEDASKKEKSEISIVEIGGTVGDYQNVMFMEAARVLKIRNPKNVLFILVSYLPVPGKLGEMKSKPTQNAMRQLYSYGISSDIIIARSEIPMDEKRREKIATSCGLYPERVISAPDIESIYDIPLNFEKGKLSELLISMLELKLRPISLLPWKKFVNSVHKAKDEIHIAVIGKYFETGEFLLSDAYLSVIEAIKYSSYALNKKPIISWLNAVDFEKNIDNLKKLENYDGIIVPGGFGSRGVEGKLNVVRYARENKIPYFGLCYGMQMMVIEYARNVLNLKDANTREVDPKSKNIVIDIMENQKDLLAKGEYGGTMRLGEYKAILSDKSIAKEAYKAKEIIERHRHRYEVSPEYIEQLEKAGLLFSGKSPNGMLMEIAELSRDKHPFFLGAQFHPELLARPLAPHPLFTSFIKACIKNKSLGHSTSK